MRNIDNISRKANRILNLILLSFLLILIRVWYLGCVQQEYHEKQARKPQRKTALEKVERATIRDRFNIPLSQNKIIYNASIRYADLREIPSYEWKKNEEGKKVKEPVRGPYISRLANRLSSELSMEAQDIEDVIYAKASLLPHTPFIIKEGLTEKEYYRIRAMQKDWRGVEAERSSKRVYPLGKTACDVIGYMGAIDPSEYLRIAQEIQKLQEYIKKREMGEVVFLPTGYANPLEVRKRLQLLQQQAYTINDQVGKAGIEGVFDEILRGVHGKQMMEIDPKGNILRKLPGGKKGVSGQRIFLAISAELQKYAEELLSTHEAFRDVKDLQGNLMSGEPWMKGGAAIALDPKTGEVLALASYPRFDPNDFIPAQTPLLKKEKQEAIGKWLENEKYIANLWNGKIPLVREIYLPNDHSFEEEKKFVTWSYFLQTIISEKSSIHKAIAEINHIKNAYLLQKHLLHILEVTSAEDPATLLHILYSGEDHVPGKKKISPEQLEFLRQKYSTSLTEIEQSVAFLNRFLCSVRYNDDKLLVLDLIKLLVNIDTWNEELIERLGSISLSEFFRLSQNFKKIHDLVQEKVEKMHHDLGFKQWRELHFKDFLKKRRKEEKAQKKPTKPYTEYLEKTEKTLFKKFWQACKLLFLDAVISSRLENVVQEYPLLSSYLQELTFLKKDLRNPALEELGVILSSLSPEQAMQWMKCMRSFDELNRPLYGKYRLLRNAKGIQLEKHLAASFYPPTGFGYVRSQAFRQSTPQGSVFKLAVAYEALREKYEHLKENQLSLEDLNPLTLIDQIQMNWPLGSLKQMLGYTLDGQPIRRLYKGGVLPRTHPNIGKIDVVSAVAQSSNIYFSLLAAEHIADPSYLEKATREFGFGEKTGIDLPGEIRGSLPEDLADNKTGLYSFAIGQHSLIVTPLQTAVMYGSLATQGEIVKPQIVSLIVGKERREDPFAMSDVSDYPFQEPLALAGIDFPLFTEALSPSYAPLIHKINPIIRRTLFLPKEIRTILLESLHQVIVGKKGLARASSIRYLKAYPRAAKEYRQLHNQLVGKTGTAEIFYKPWIDAESKAEIRNHIWFAGIVFPEDKSLETSTWGEAELVVVIYAQFSQFGGKEVAPLAAQIATKWREIKKKYNAKSYWDKLASLEEEKLE
jgi:cell division protein FtsI/penicillin-binding protein 2